MATRKLVISFTGLIGQISRGELSAEDLTDALFYFGCTRLHALTPGADGETSELDWFVRYLDEAEAQAERQRIHGIIKEAVVKAEQDGRAVFRETVDERNSLEKLNLLLAANGFAKLVDTEGYYSYPYVEERVAAQKLPLKVVWR